MLNPFSVRLVALIMAMMCLPKAAQALEPVHCAIASVQLGALTTPLHLNVPQYVEGQVQVMCASTSTHPQTIELGLIEVVDEALRHGQSAAPPVPSSLIRVDLYSDGTRHKVLPLKASELHDYGTRHVIPSASTAQLSIPFYARVVVETLMSAGKYNIARDIGLVYHTSASE